MKPRPAPFPQLAEMVLVQDQAAVMGTVKASETAAEQTPEADVTEIAAP